MPYVDLAFRLTGSKVPVDHGYALYSALSRLLPEIHGAKNIGVHPRSACGKPFLTPFFQPQKCAC